MDVGVATVIAACVTAVCGLIAFAVGEFRDMRRENREDHGAVMQKLNKVEEGVVHVKERLDDHIDWHLKK